MRDAVLQDLNQLLGISTLCTYDSRLPKPPHAHQAVMAGHDVWALWKQCIAEADAVLPIAPETGNVLLALTDAIQARDKTLIGCSAEGVALASSKLATYSVLQSAGVDAVSTYETASFPAHQFERCVVKPDDGAGCSDAQVLSRDEFNEWCINHKAGYVAQPYLEGVPASLSMLCNQGQAWLLSCNRQKVTVVSSGAFVYQGSVLNGVGECWHEFAQLAKAVAQAIPSLTGYIGVDVIIHKNGISVLEINPRLTTSYVSLHKAMGCNPAELLLDLLYNSRFSSQAFHMPAIQRNIVDVSLDA